MAKLFLVAIMAAAATVAVAGVANSGLPADPIIDRHGRRVLDAFLAGKPDADDVRQGGSETAQALALVGREDLVMHLPIFQGHGRRTCLPLKANGSPVDPVAYIAERAKNYRVTMINEAHDMPQTRLFASKIAEALRPENYMLYAAETFDAGINPTSPAWPLPTDGYYVNEPIFGRLIRSLRTLGFRFLPYEFLAPIDNTKPLAGQIEKREIGQASNLEKLINAARPEDKLLIHVGYSHLEKSENGPIKMMAAHFLEDTGLNPLTVSQTNYWSPTGRYEICDPAALHVTDPSTLFVGAPKPAFFRGRPSWRIAAGDHIVETPPVLRRPADTVIYEARSIHEPDSAVPIDRILVRAGEDIPLLLPPGEYRVSAWTQGNGWLGTVTLRVQN